MNPVLWKFWNWPRAVLKLAEIRKFTSKYYNDARMTKITGIIDK